MDEEGLRIRMRILFTQETDWIQRNPAQQHHLAEMLSLRGHEIRVIDFELLWRTQDKRGLHSQRAVFDNITKAHDGATVKIIRPGIIKIPVLDYVSLVFSHHKEIERQIKEFAPDVIVGWGILNSYLAIRAARKHKIPFVYYWIDVLEKLIPVKSFQGIGKFIESRTLRNSDKVLVINEKLKDYVVTLGALPQQTQILKAGVNIEQFNPDNENKTIRKQYGFDKGDIVLFFMGWMYHFSGLKETALELVKIKNDRIKLLIVGDGDAYDELQQIRTRYNLQERLILTGKKSYQEIPSFIAAADVCLLPAYIDEEIMQDIVPIKMYEYMSMKKPVIATRLPGVVKEFGQDNGVVYIDRPEEVPEKALEILGNNKAEDLGNRGRRFVERYSWENITDEFETILEGVIEEKKNE